MSGPVASEAACVQAATLAAFVTRALQAAGLQAGDADVDKPRVFRLPPDKRCAAIAAKMPEGFGRGTVGGGFSGGQRERG